MNDINPYTLFSVNDKNKETNNKISYLMDRLDLLFEEMNKAYLRLIELEQWRYQQEDDFK